MSNHNLLKTDLSALNGKKGYVYFIEDFLNNRIKIGFTAKNPFTRLAEIKSAIMNQNLKLIGVIQGSVDMETALHMIYHDYRLEKEWFSVEVKVFLKHSKMIDLNSLEQDYNKANRLSVKKESIRPLLLHNNLYFLCENKNHSEIARAINISNSLIHDWISCRRSPSLKNAANIYKLAQYFNVTFEDLFFKDLRQEFIKNELPLSKV